MSDDLIEIVEEITFTPQGGSPHVWRLPDGSVWREEVFDISPVMFLRRTETFGFDTATDRGIVSVNRHATLQNDVVQP